MFFFGAGMAGRKPSQVGLGDHERYKVRAGCQPACGHCPAACCLLGCRLQPPSALACQRHFVCNLPGGSRLLTRRPVPCRPPCVCTGLGLAGEAWGREGGLQGQWHVLVHCPAYRALSTAGCASDARSLARIRCEFGNKCHFAHGPDELRERPQNARLGPLGKVRCSKQARHQQDALLPPAAAPQRLALRRCCTARCLQLLCVPQLPRLKASAIPPNCPIPHDCPAPPAGLAPCSSPRGTRTRPGSTLISRTRRGCPTRPASTTHGAPSL